MHRLFQISQISLIQAPYFDFYGGPRGRVPLDFPVWYIAILLVEIESNNMFLKDAPPIDG